jgi:hypothetical protein
MAQGGRGHHYGQVTLGLSGQVCLAQTRALMHRDVADEFLATAEVIGGMVSHGTRSTRRSPRHR